MCMGIYAALIGLFAFYSNYVINQYALVVNSAGGGTMTVAVGWEMVPLLWPVIVAAMLLASALSVYVTRRISCRDGRCAGSAGRDVE